MSSFNHGNSEGRILTLVWGMVLLAVTEWPAAAFYDPHAGRWLTRDPIGEEGGPHLYGLCDNDGIDRIDVLGLATPLPPPPAPAPAFDIKAVPGIMTANGWTKAAALQKRWFSNPAIGPQLPDTTTITMSWVLKYARAKKVYDEIISQKLYVNPAAKAQIKKTHGNKNGAFGDLSLPVPVLDQESIQYRTVGFSIFDPIDDLSAALGNFTFRRVFESMTSAAV